jgi:hypothetical protein
MRTVFQVCLVVAFCASELLAADIVDGVLAVEGKPFYPLGSWNSSYTTPEDMDRLGMNISFRAGPGTAEAVATFREFMRRCDKFGIQVVPYLSYGGAGITPWPPESVRTISKLATEPNLLAWYVGDDIGMPHLPGIQQTVGILREETPSVPTVADYIAKQTPEAKTTFTKYIDIRCQYDYPIPNKSFPDYLEFFDEQREFVGDPLWTWVQTFMWGRTGRLLNVGGEGPGPVPDPEQVRLLSFSAINRGVRGLLFFPHHELHRQPELAAEVALICREIRLLEGHLAAGETVMNLKTSLPEVNATSFRHGDSTVISAAVVKPFYHRWVDEAIVKNVTIESPWPDGRLPQALLVATPDVVECLVEACSISGKIKVTVPSMELGGFILISNDQRELKRLQTGVEAIPATMTRLVAQAAAVQTRKVADIVWQLDSDTLYVPSILLDAFRAGERCADAVEEGDAVAAVRSWREALRANRCVMTTIMHKAESLKDLIPPSQQQYLISPYGLHNIRGLGQAPARGDPWHFIQTWRIAGPFPLQWAGDDNRATPAGFDRVYPPETSTDAAVTFSTVDGKAPWRAAETDMSCGLDFLQHFATSENVICYAKSFIVAPRDIDTRMSLGSNDGAKVWVNGTQVFAWSGGRPAKTHQDEFPIRLNEGRNMVLVKVENFGASWQLYLSIHDPKRELAFEAY